MIQLAFLVRIQGLIETFRQTMSNKCKQFLCVPGLCTMRYFILFFIFFRNKHTHKRERERDSNIKFLMVE